MQTVTADKPTAGPRGPAIRQPPQPADDPAESPGGAARAAGTGTLAIPRPPTPLQASATPLNTEARAELAASRTRWESALRSHWLPLATAGVLFAVLTTTFRSYTDPLLAPDSEIWAKMPTRVADHHRAGVALVRRALRRPATVLVSGSSELEPHDRFHPARFFRERGTAVQPLLWGRARCQSLVHLIAQAAIYDELAGRRTVAIASPQWFDLAHVNPRAWYLESRLSPLQTASVMLNPRVPDAIKRHIADRLIELGMPVRYPLLGLLLDAERSNPGYSRVVRPVAAGAVTAESVILGFLDDLALRLDVATLHWQQSRAPAQTPPQWRKLVAWAQLRKEAVAEGQRFATNNPFAIDDDYYDKYIGPDPARHRRRWCREAAIAPDGDEYRDFAAWVELLRHAGAEPLFILPPVNGRWYTFVGLDLAEMDRWYDRLGEMIESAGFPAKDYRRHHMTPYFLRDVMHLGWLGWAYIDEAIFEYML